MKLYIILLFIFSLVDCAQEALWHPYDKVAPTVPSGLTATAVSSSQINLTWNASTDSKGVTGYKIFQNGIQITTVTSTSFSNTGLAAATTYSYTVAAYDAAGNTSAQSGLVSTTTQILTSVNGTTYYVSPSGNDANSGTSLSTPVKTIRNALSKATKSGDIIYVMTGTYAESFNITQSGITLSAYPNNKPVIDGQTLPGVDWNVQIGIDGNYNTISGFEVKNVNLDGTHQGGYGIQLGGHHNTVSKMNVHHTWENGIIVNGDYNTVEDSTVWQCAYQNFNNNAGGWSSGLSAARNNNTSALKPGITSYATFRRNTVFNNWGEGLSCYEVDHCTVEDNVVYDNFTVNLYLSDATNSLVQRNLVYVSSAPQIMLIPGGWKPGIILADEVASVSRSANNTIINNFIYNAEFDAFSWTNVANSGLNNVLIANNTIIDGALYTGSGGSSTIVNTNSQIRNNVVLGDSYVPDNQGIIFSNNYWAVIPSEGASGTDVVSDPQIARTGTTTPGSLTPDYFKTFANSPVINAATPLPSVTSDFFKVGRDAAPDIGGYELK